MSVALHVIEPVGPWAVTLRKLAAYERRVVAAEHDGLEARWEFGRELLAKRVEYKGRRVIPRDLMAEAMSQLGLGRSEINHRVQFAEAYPSQDQMSDAVRDYPTWRAMTHAGLPKKPHAKPAPGASVRKRVSSAALSQYRNTNAAELTEAEWKVLDALYEELTRLYEEASSTRG